MKERLINFIADSFGGLSFKLLPYFLFQLALSALMAWTIEYIISKREKTTQPEKPVYKLMLISVVFCMLTFFAHYSLSLAIFWAIIAGFLILKMTIVDKREFYLSIITIALSSGIGAGFVIPTLISFLLILALILLNTRTQKEK